MQLSAAGFSHIGMKRTQNQDSFLCVPDIATFVVADGMGGHKGGETASLLTVTTLCDYIREHRHSRNSGDFDPQQTLIDAIREANRAVFRRSQDDKELQGMGTTCTALVFDQARVYIGHVGDSRCYLNHPHRIWQLTRDHSLVQEKLRAGLITRDQLKTDRMKNVITRSVGFEDSVQIDLSVMEIQPGDTFLICSDGLSGMCDDQEINQIISQLAFADGGLDRAAKELCNAANRNGGEDNVTALLIRYEAP